MTRSDNINELAAAMSKAQGQIENAAKDSANPYFRSKYADLASCWDACRKALSDNGLAVLQPARISGAQVTITTLLAHSSGQWLSEDLTMTSKRQLKDGGGWEEMDNPQALGSTITYARRYALSAMVGIAPEDDDGNAGSGRQDDRRREDGPRGEPVQQPTNIPAELKPIFAGMRKDPANIIKAYTMMQKELAAFDGGLEFYDKLCEAFSAKYPKGAPGQAHEGAILDLYEAIQRFKSAAKQPEVIA